MNSLFCYLLLLALTLPSFAVTKKQIDIFQVVDHVNKLSQNKRDEIITELMATRSHSDQAIYKEVTSKLAFPKLEVDAEGMTFKIDGQKFLLNDINWQTGSYRLNGVVMHAQDSFEEMAKKMNPEKPTKTSLFSFFIPSAHAQLLAAGAFIAANWKTIVVIAAVVAGVAVAVGWPYLSVTTTTEVEIQEVESECEVLKSGAIKRKKLTGEKNDKVAARDVLKTNTLVERLKALKNRDSKVISRNKVLKTQVQTTEGCVEETQRMLTAEIEAMEKAKSDESSRNTKSVRPVSPAPRRHAIGARAN